MIIGLNGTMGVGKSTAAALIDKVSINPVKLVKFAGPLYDMQEYIYRRISKAHASEKGIDSALISRYVRNDGTELEFDKNMLRVLKEQGLQVKKEYI